MAVYTHVPAEMLAELLAGYDLGGANYPPQSSLTTTEPFIMIQALPDSYAVFVSNALDGDISVFHLDTESGQIEAISRHAAAEAVMPLALSAVGIGASVSGVLTGYSADLLGSTATFLLLAAVAAVGLAVAWTLMPETRPQVG